MTRVFICYSSQDRATALRLHKDLESGGISAWIDAKDLLPGQEWRYEISAAIRRSDYFLALMSKRSIGKSGYVQKELRLALEVLEELPPGDVFVIPVRLEPCEPRHPQLQDTQWVDLFPVYEAGLERILLALAQRGVEVPVSQVDPNKTAWMLYDFLRQTDPQITQTLQRSSVPLRILVSSSRTVEIDTIIQRTDFLQYASVWKDNNYIANMVGLRGYVTDMAGQPWTGYVFTLNPRFYDVVT